MHDLVSNCVEINGPEILPKNTHCKYSVLYAQCGNYGNLLKNNFDKKLRETNVFKKQFTKELIS